MKIRIEVTKGQTGTMEPKGFAGAITGHGQALFGDSATAEFKDEMAAQSADELVTIIEALGKSVTDALTGIDKPDAVG